MSTGDDVNDAGCCGSTVVAVAATRTVELTKGSIWKDAFTGATKRDIS